MNRPIDVTEVGIRHCEPFADYMMSHYGGRFRLFQRPDQAACFSFDATRVANGDIHLVESRATAYDLQCEALKRVCLISTVNRGLRAMAGYDRHIDLEPMRTGVLIVDAAKKIMRGADTITHVLSMDAGRLSDDLELYSHSPNYLSGHRGVVELRHPDAARLFRLQRFVITETAQSHGFDKPDRHLNGLLQLLKDSFLDLLTIDRPDEKAIAGSTMALAEAFIHANLAEPIGVNDIARLTNVSGRTIHASFRRRHGQSLSAFIRRCRLDRVRQALLNGQTESVTDAALSCGFNHLGRFSHYYSKRFGEKPSDTLKAARKPGQA